MVVDDKQHVIGGAEVLQVLGQGETFTLVTQLVPKLEHLGSAPDGGGGYFQRGTPAGDLGVDDYVQPPDPVGLLAPEGRSQFAGQRGQSPVEAGGCFRSEPRDHGIAQQPPATGD